MQAPTGLVERDAQLAQLDAAVARARAGRGGVALVTGEPGIGKTALVDRLVRSLGDDPPDGVRVLVGHCDPLTAPGALGPLEEVAARLRLATATDRDALAGRLLAALRDGPPTVLVVEDAHWADAASAGVLGVLGRRAARLPLLLVLTYRDAEVGTAHPLHAVVAELVTSGSTLWLGLPALTPDGVRELAAGAVDPVRLHERTGGNPFYVTEALAAPDADVPATVRLAVLGRTARLGADAREVLDVVAVVPGRSDAALVRAVAGHGDDVVERCVAAGVLVERDGSLAFRHELARLALWSELPQARRRDLHARVLAALEAAGAPVPAHLAHHAAAA
ncbi:AAA family ATPase, partial [Angustibacter speluncae]